MWKTLNDYMNILSERNKCNLQKEFGKILSEDYDPNEIIFFGSGYSFHEISKMYFYKNDKYFLVKNECSCSDEDDYWGVSVLTKDDVKLIPTREEWNNAYEKVESVNRKWGDEIARLKSRIEYATREWNDEIASIQSENTGYHLSLKVK